MPPSPSSRSKLDFWRGVAIVAVVGLHAIDLVSQGHTFIVGGINVHLIVDQLGRFSVPLFVALSGYVLAKGYGQKLDLPRFFSRRIARIVPAYLGWSLVLYYFLRLPTVWFQRETYPLWEVLLFGKGDYHLYFVPMIIQLYLLFPLIIMALRRQKVWMLMAAFVVQLAVLCLFTYKNEVQRLWGEWSDLRAYFFFGTWVFYFVLGAFVESIKPDVLARYRKVFLLLTGVGAVLVIGDAFRLMNGGYGLLAVTRFTRVPVMVYATGVILLVLSQTDASKSFQRVPKFLVNVMTRLGRDSYYIYLMHTLVMRVVLLVAAPLLGGNALLLGTAMLVGSELVVIGYQRVAGFFKKREQ